MLNVAFWHAHQQLTDLDSEHARIGIWFSMFERLWRFCGMMKGGMVRVANAKQLGGPWNGEGTRRVTALVLRCLQPSMLWVGGCEGTSWVCSTADFRGELREGGGGGAKCVCVCVCVCVTP